MTQEQEMCFHCDEPTGKAGKADDSLYDAATGYGPYCGSCWDNVVGLPKTAALNIPALLAELKRAREAFINERNRRCAQDIVADPAKFLADVKEVVAEAALNCSPGSLEERISIMAAHLPKEPVWYCPKCQSTDGHIELESASNLGPWMCHNCTFYGVPNKEAP